MLDLHKVKRKEKDMFNEAWEQVCTENSEYCVGILKKYEKEKKTVFEDFHLIA
jgi:hypothetical protein